MDPKFVVILLFHLFSSSLSLSLNLAIIFCCLFLFFVPCSCKTSVIFSIKLLQGPQPLQFRKKNVKLILFQRIVFGSINPHNLFIKAFVNDVILFNNQ